jgi:hypothetical protein
VTTPASAVLSREVSRLARAGIRMVPLRRADPASSWYGDCPRCHVFGALHVETDGSWRTTCGCRLGGYELELAALLVDPAADRR